MNKLNINYIETTLNGYIIKRVKITEYDKNKDYCGELHFKLNNEDVEYYEEFSGSWDTLDEFLSCGESESIIEYQEDNHLETKPNILLEYWKTDNLGWYEDKYIGLEISNKEKLGV